MVAATDSAGDAYPGKSRPSIEPYPRCADDPNGYAVVAPKTGYWSSGHSTSYDYEGIADVFGFKFGGSNGFTNDIYESWDDRGPSPTYVCGNKNPVNATLVPLPGYPAPGWCTSG